MTKKEIEGQILQECLAFIPTVGAMPFDQAFPLIQREAWRIADKYDTDGANVINILFSKFAGKN